MKFEITCIDDKNKPKEYPITDVWVKEGNVYNTFKVAYLIDGNIGIQVEEITPSEENPFEYFKIQRFGIKQEDLEEFEKWVTESLNNQEHGELIDIDELLKEELEYEF